MNLESVMLLGAAVILIAILAARIGSGLGLPSLLLFLAVGRLLGESGLGVQLSDPELAHALGFGALVLILAEGGLTTRWVEIKGAIPTAGLLATFGIAVSVGLMALFGYFVLGMDVYLAILLGAVCSPTDSAAVFSVLRKVPLPARVRSMLEAESGLNDAPTVLLVTAVSALSTGASHQSPLALLAMIGFELIGGLFFGIALGWIGVIVMRNIALPSSGLYPLAAVVWCVLAYGVSAQVHTSGFAAVYVCGVMLGNGRLPHRQATRSFIEGIGWIAQIGLFVMLGLLTTSSRLTWQEVGVAVAAGLFLTLIVRPASVLACATWFRIPLVEQAFLSWAGLRGAVPIILATIPLAYHVDRAGTLFDEVLIFVVVFTLLQAPTLPWVAGRLGLVRGEATDVEVEAAPLEQLKADLLQVRVPAGSKLVNVEISELRLPKDTVVSLIIRDEKPFAPHGRTKLHTADELLIVTPAASRSQVEERLHEVGRSGRLARWRRDQRPAADYNDAD